MTEQVDDFLVHYGVRGMKWGKRKSEPKVSKEDKLAAKAAYVAYGNPIIEKRVDQMFDDSGMSQKQYSQLSTKDIKFKAGKEFYRVSPRKDEQFRDMTYVSYLKEDRTRYQAVMPSTGLQGLKKNYEYVYQATKDLSSPSEKARVDAFIELMDTPAIKMGKKTLTGREVLKREGFGKEVKTMTSQQLGLKFYNENSALMIRPNPTNTAYFKLLQSKGYNSLHDDNDRGVVSEAPLIILDPTGHVKKMSVRQLSKQDIVDAKKNIKRVL